MSTIHFVGGEKGGVGKSVVARLLAQLWIDRDHAWRGFDTDRSHGALLRYYDGYAEPLDPDRVEGLDRLIEAATEHPQRVLVDLAAQTEGRLHGWIEDGGVLDLAGELGIDIVFWHVMDGGKDSLRLLERLLDRHGDRASYRILLNEGRASSFTLFDNSGIAARARAWNVPVGRIRALHEPTMMRIDALDKSFWAAAHHSGSQALNIMDRQRVKVWLRRSYEELERLGA